MLRIFIGTDERQPIAYNVLQYSIMDNASVPVSITPLVLRTLPISRTGLTQFTYSRYLVPYLCNYEGQALFLDADMIVDADIAELFKLADPNCGASVVKKIPSFESMSLMLFNCEKCKRLTPELIQNETPQALGQWSDGGIGELPFEWNYCVGYDHEDIKPKLIHYTAGIPIWAETRNSKFAERFHHYTNKMLYSTGYAELMAGSVHHAKVMTKEIEK